MKTRRFLLVDQNIRDTSGHFLELALVILRAAKERGYETTLVTNSAFRPETVLSHTWNIRPLLSHYKMQRWSLTAYGHSLVARDRNGDPGINGVLPLLQRVRDRLHVERPQVMLDQFASELAPFLKEFQPTENDEVLFGTCDDFCALAVAEAFRRAALARPANIHILSHASYQERRECEWASTRCRSPHFTRQIAMTRDAFSPHRLQFWATTRELANQLNWAASAQFWKPLNYPIRDCFSPLNSIVNGPKRILLGGATRSEKGLKRIGALISQLWKSHLEPGRWQLAIQASKNLYSSILPGELRAKVPEWAEQGDRAPVVLASPHLDSAEYERLLQTANLGLFLYDGRRYYTRCSGVLVEMLACGVPVIVPAGSWLSRQIASIQDQYVEQQEHLVNQPLVTHITEAKLSPKESSAIVCQVKSPSAAIIRIAASFSDVKQCDYVAIRTVSLNSQGKSIRSDISIRECCPTGKTQLLFNVHPEADSLAIHIWSPYPQRPILLSKIEVFKASSETLGLPLNSVGLVDSEFSGISRYVDEVEEHYEHYRESAIRFSAEWRVRHSGPGFLSDLLNSSHHHDSNPALPRT